MIEESCCKLQGIFDCKECCQFFDSLAKPVALLGGISALLRQATGNALAFAVQIAADLAKLYTSFMEQKGVETDQEWHILWQERRTWTH